MQITWFTPEDREAIRACAAIDQAAGAVDAPWLPPRTEHEVHGFLRYGWDLEPAIPALGVVDGEAVASGWYRASERDNRHLAWLRVEVAPEHRRRGHGTAMLRHLLERVTELGRTTVGASAWDGTAGEPFAIHHGFEQKSVAVNRGQHLPDVDRAVLDRIHAEAAERAADYELVRMPAVAADADLEALAVLTAAINDAPTDGLEVEDEVFDAERVRAYETAQQGRGNLLHRLVARHRPSGELAGQTVVAVDGERTHLAEQHDTSVVGAHRGHRLGALLKTGMLQWLREEQPQLEWIYTWNAESNDFMIGVNEQLGYRVLGRELALQRSL